MAAAVLRVAAVLQAAAVLQPVAAVLQAVALRQVLLPPVVADVPQDLQPQSIK